MIIFGAIKFAINVPLLFLHYCNSTSIAYCRLTYWQDGNIRNTLFLPLILVVQFLKIIGWKINISLFIYPGAGAAMSCGLHK